VLQGITTQHAVTYATSVARQLGDSAVCTAKVGLPGLPAACTSLTSLEHWHAPTCGAAACMAASDMSQCSPRVHGQPGAPWVVLQGAHGLLELAASALAMFSQRPAAHSTLMTCGSVSALIALTHPSHTPSCVESAAVALGNMAADSSCR